MGDFLWWLFGAGSALMAQGMFRVARRSWYRHLAPPTSPVSPAQIANRATYEATQAHHPVVVSARLQRRTPRTGLRSKVEDNPFEGA